MGRVGPACRRFVRYYRNRVFSAFFHALLKIGSCEIGTRSWLQRSEPLLAQFRLKCLVH